MRRIALITVIIISGLLAGCAKQGMPSGGPKDATPPKTLHTRPDNRTLGFAEKSFYIEFDEYVVIKDAENNIMVSPPLHNKPEYKTKGKGIQVKLNDTLQANTTYLFQFKEAIADYNEGNILPTLEYVFSTGNYIDSMSVSGKVVDALTMEPREEAVNVWLMEVDEGKRFASTWGDTSAAPPTQAYTTRCDKDGNFSFNYIRPGEYCIYAVQDEDKNMQIGANESMGFWGGTIKARRMNDSTEVDSTAAPTAKQDVRLLIFTPQNDKQRITGSDFKAAGTARITTLLPMQAPKIECEEPLTWRLNATHDTLTLWTFSEKCDSLQLIVSDPTGIQDTLKMRWRPKKGKPTAGQTEDKTGMKIATKTLPYFDTLWLTFKTPLDTARCQLDSAARIMLMKDSSVTYCRALVDSTAMKASLDHSFLAGEKYTIEIAKDRFLDIYGHANDSLQSSLSVTKTEDYGNLRITLQDSTGTTAAETKLIVQLMDEKKKVVTERHTTAEDAKSIEFLHITPNKYRVRVIEDLNGNGKWDGGDFAAGKQPERVVYMDKTLDIRANWDFDEKLTMPKVTNK